MARIFTQVDLLLVPSLRDEILNARTNIIVSIRMVHRHGWGPWGG